MKAIICSLCYVIFAPLIGGLLDGLDRKISARMQGRVGPPLLQPFYDLNKLHNKQLIAVSKSQTFLMISYLLMMILTGALFYAGYDILMCFFVMSTASTFLYFAAIVTGSPYSTIGASRELIQMMAYEPAVLLACVGFYLCMGTFDVAKIINSVVSTIVYLPGFFIAFVFILTIKLRKSPFDISTSHHAHQELIKGLTTEFGAKNLALFQLTEWYEVTFLCGVVGLFIINSNPISIIGAIAVVFVVWFLEILIDNCSARVKFDLMLKISWIVTLLSAGVNLLILMINR